MVEEIKKRGGSKPNNVSYFVLPEMFLQDRLLRGSSVSEDFYTFFNQNFHKVIILDWMI